MGITKRTSTSLAAGSLTHATLPAEARPRSAWVADEAWTAVSENTAVRMLARDRIGFMQGRLSAPVDGQIQAFPWGNWRTEFLLARVHGFRVMEWTLDADRLRENPLLTLLGQAEVRQLSDDHGLQVGSVTGDFFMQAPFFRATGAGRQARLDDLARVIDACLAMAVPFLVLPLVDDGRVDGPRTADAVVEALTALQARYRGAPFTLLFESDFPPDALAAFVGRFPSTGFGVNLDLGNSAALGHDSVREVELLAPLIRNVHVKDRTRGGPTVPLGAGAADLPASLAALRRVGYTGNLILQTARADDGDHAGVLVRYRDLVCDCMVTA